MVSRRTLIKGTAALPLAGTAVFALAQRRAGVRPRMDR